jgi:hypothetical protein
MVTHRTAGTADLGDLLDVVQPGDVVGARFKNRLGTF